MDQTVHQGTAINFNDLDNQSLDAGEYNNWSENELREELERHGERASNHCDRNGLINKLNRCGTKGRSGSNTSNKKSNSSQKSSDCKSNQQRKFHNFTETQLREELKSYGETVKDNVDRSEMIRKLNCYVNDSSESLSNQIPPQSVNKSIKKQEIQYGSLNRQQDDSQLVQNEGKQDQKQGKQATQSGQKDNNSGKDIQTKQKDNKLGQDTQSGQNDYQSNQQDLQSKQQDNQSGKQDSGSNQKKSQSEQRENESGQHDQQIDKQDFKCGDHQTQFERQNEQFGGLETEPSVKDQHSEKQYEINKRRENDSFQEMKQSRKQDGNHGKHDT